MPIEDNSVAIQTQRQVFDFEGLTSEEVTIIKERKEMTPQLMRKLVTKVKNKLNRKFRRAHKDYTWVLLLGVTGSGKTTLLHALAGKRLVGVEDEGCGIVLQAIEPLRDEDGEFIISSSAVAETFLPNVWVDDENHIVYIDCPGFLDTTKSWRLINSFIVDCVLNHAQNVKIELVVSHEQLTGKGDGAREALDLITQMFPVESERNQAVGVVITKFDSSKRGTPVGLLTRLAKGSTGPTRQLLDRLLNAASDKIFTFPDVEDEGEYDLFTDRDNLIHSFQRNPVVNPKHEIAMDDASKVLVPTLTSQFLEEKVEALNSLVDILKRNVNGLDAIPFISNPIVIGEWLLHTTLLKAALELGWDVLAERCRELCKLDGSFADPTHKIEELENWELFTAKVSKLSALAGIVSDTMNSPIKVIFDRLGFVIEVLTAKRNCVLGIITPEDLVTIMKDAQRRDELALTVIKTLVPALIVRSLVIFGLAIQGALDAVKTAVTELVMIPVKVVKGIGSAICSVGRWISSWFSG